VPAVSERDLKGQGKDGRRMRTLGLKFAAIVLFALCLGAPAARANSFPILPKLFPQAQASGLKLAYTVNDALNPTKGHLSVCWPTTGTLSVYASQFDLDHLISTDYPNAGFQMDVAFNIAGGKGTVDLGDAGNGLRLVDNLGHNLFFSDTLKLTNLPSKTMKFLWENDGGLQAGTSAAPFIGVYLTVGSFTNFDANFAKAFTGSSVTADLFMTPTPLAATGGIGLLLGLFGVRGRGYRGRALGCP